MNLTFLYTFISADFLQSSYSGFQQMNIFLNGDPNVNENNYFSNDLQRVEMSKLMPNIDERFAIYNMLNAINELELDPFELVLVMAIALFNISNDKIKNVSNIISIQDYLRQTLFRYLTSKMSLTGAQMKAEKIGNVLNVLLTSKDMNLLMREA